MGRQKRGMGLFGRGVGRICAVAAASTAAEMAAQVRLALRETPTVELRLDWLANDRERERVLNWLRKWRKRSTRGNFVATCRRRVGGGEYAGNGAEELAWLARAKEAGCRWCDLEIETLRELPAWARRELPRLPRILLSVHDFNRMPELGRVAALGRRKDIGAIKVAARARSTGDGVRLLRFARQTPNCVAVAMGEVGVPARL